MKGTVCFFGIFDPNYARTKVLHQGFEAHGYEVVFCRVDPAQYGGFKTSFALYKEWKKIRDRHFSLVIVCFPGQSVVWLARFLFGKRIVFDAFLSLLDSNVYDRALYSAYSMRGIRDWLLDWSSVRLAGTVLLDTQAHINYFHERFGVSVSKCLRVWISADPKMFYPRAQSKPSSVCAVEFHGTFIPLQGVPYIVEAISYIKNSAARFVIIGNGQDSRRVTEVVSKYGLQDRISFLGRVPVGEIPGHLASADIALGIFGNTPKTLRVIPNKVYEAMAMGKAVITADSPAMRELIPQGDAVCLVPVADPKALAEAITRLVSNTEERERLGAQARELFVSKLMPKQIVQEIIDACVIVGRT